MIRTKRRLYIIALSLILLLVQFPNITHGKSQLPESSHEFYVYDELYLLEDTTKDYLIQVNRNLYDQVGVQIVTAVVDSLRDMDINSYATALYEKWKIGSKEKDNGILILIVPNDRELWIEVGYGLEGILPDSRVKKIINEDILPDFGQGDYDRGVLQGFEKIVDYIKVEYDIEVDIDSPVEERFPEASIPGKYIVLIIILLLFVDIRFFRGWFLYNILRNSTRGGSGGYGGSSGRGGGSSGGGGRSGGGGAGGKW